MTTEQRFWAKVRKTPTCWLWTASRRNKGYGAFAYTKDGVLIQDRAHRYSWTIHRGPIPEGLFVLHNCPGGDNPACVNPAHLFLGTNRINVEDMVRKGRHVAGGQRPGVKYRYRKGVDHPGARLKEEDIARIRRRRAAGQSFGKISREEKLSIGHVFRIVTRKAWRDSR